MKNIVIVGAGGFGRGVAWLIEEINKVKIEWNLLGFVDDSNNPDIERLSGYKIVGDTDWLKEQNCYVIVAIANPIIKREIVNKLENINLKFATLIHPDVIVPTTTRVGEGTFIYSGTRINVNVIIGKHVSINYNNVVGHDAILKDFVTLLPSVNISGNVLLEEAVSMGTNSIILPGLSVGRESVVGAAALITKDMPESATIYGVPAQVKKSIRSKR